MLRPKTVIALAIAGGVVALGIALNDGGSGATVISGVLVLLGGGGAAVTIALWAVRASNLAGRARVPHAETARLGAFVEELVACAKEAESKGVLSLTGRTIGQCGELFRLGTEMVIAGESVEVIRSRLAHLGDQAGETESKARDRIVRVCRWVPLGALGLSLVFVVWLLASTVALGGLGSLAPLGLLLAVYGAFAVAAIAVEVGDRFVAEGLERELFAGMVIETLAAIRSGESAARIEARLKGVLTPGLTSAESGTGLRRAA